MILRALDLSFQMRIYRWLVKRVMAIPMCDPHQHGLAKLTIEIENKVTRAIIAEDTRVAALAATLAGGGFHWSSLIEGKRALDEGRPLGTGGVS